MKVVINRILCPMDFSETSDLALRHAVALAEQNRAELTLLLVDERNGSRLVGQMVSAGAAPLASGTDRPTAEQAAEAMTAALGNALASLERALLRVT